MLGKNVADDRQAQAGAASLGGKVRQKQFFLVSGGNSAAGVRDQQLHRIGARSARVTHQQPLDQRVAHRFGGVVHQVHHHALELLRIQIDAGQIGRQIHAQIDPVQPAVENIQRVPDDVVQIAGTGCAAGKRENCENSSASVLTDSTSREMVARAFPQHALRFGRRTLPRSRLARDALGATARWASADSSVRARSAAPLHARPRLFARATFRWCLRAPPRIPVRPAGCAGSAETVTARCSTWPGRSQIHLAGGQPVRRARFIRYCDFGGILGRKQIAEVRGALHLFGGKQPAARDSRAGCGRRRSARSRRWECFRESLR